jgi:hypothetical protein
MPCYHPTLLLTLLSKRGVIFKAENSSIDNIKMRLLKARTLAAANEKQPVDIVRFVLGRYF